MNAKQEFIDFVGNTKVLCAYVTYGWGIWDEEEDRTVNLPCNYTKEQYEEFLNQLDFNYDSGFGGQYLFGKIWFENGTWADRGEYDGSEWWQHHERPEIPQSLKNQ
jgi:hypothetical protein